jgi:hypothetical protein
MNLERMADKEVSKETSGDRNKLLEMQRLALMSWERDDPEDENWIKGWDEGYLRLLEKHMESQIPKEEENH